MFGVRLSSLFTSCWMALLWAMLVILTAIEFVGSDQSRSGTGDIASDGISNEQRANIANAL